MVINVVPDLACVRCINNVGHASFNVSKAVSFNVSKVCRCAQI